MSRVAARIESSLMAERRARHRQRLCAIGSEPNAQFDPRSALDMLPKFKKLLMLISNIISRHCTRKHRKKDLSRIYFVRGLRGKSHRGKTFLSFISFFRVTAIYPLPYISFSKGFLVILLRRTRQTESLCDGKNEETK